MKKTAPLNKSMQKAALNRVRLASTYNSKSSKMPIRKVRKSPLSKTPVPSKTLATGKPSNLAIAAAERIKKTQRKSMPVGNKKTPPTASPKGKGVKWGGKN